MKNLLPWILAGLFLFLALYFYWQKNEAESRLAIADSRVEEIDEELSQKNEAVDSLVPVDGSMGGTMAIRDSRILNDRYAMAYYEDGHNGGYMLLKYTVNNGNINWTVVDNSRL